MKLLGENVSSFHVTDGYVFGLGAGGFALKVVAWHITVSEPTAT